MEVRKDVKPDPFHQAVIDAAVEAGIPFNPDYNGESQLGISAMQYVIKDGTRNSTARAYLGAVLEHPNLTILTESTARRLIFKRDRCVGVEYERDGRTETAYADGEVVVSGGTIGSPGLLLASGIGPADELRALGIDVVADLPGVGRNLHDHLLSPIIYRSKEIPPATYGVPYMQTHLFAKSKPGLLVPDLQPLHFALPMYEPWMESDLPDRLHAHGRHGPPAEPRHDQARRARSLRRPAHRRARARGAGGRRHDPRRDRHRALDRRGGPARRRVGRDGALPGARTSGRSRS